MSTSTSEYRKRLRSSVSPNQDSNPSNYKKIKNNNGENQAKNVQVAQGILRRIDPSVPVESTAFSSKV